MSLQGDLEFRDANKITFIGGSSNTLIDLTTGSLGVGVTGTSLSSNLHVAGNKIKVGDNIFSTDGPHARLPKEVPLKKYPEIIFESGKFDSNDSTNTYVQAGYTVTASTTNPDTTTKPWKAFNDTQFEGNGGWCTPSVYTTSDGSATSSATEFPSGRRGEYIDLKLPKAIKVDYFIIKSRQGVGTAAYIPEDAPGEGYLYGSDNGSNWEQIKEFTGLTYGNDNVPSQEMVEVGSTTFYKYLRLQGTKRSGQHSTDQFLAIGELEYYGYEEDPPAGDTSVDTTFASIMNTPQTTGANVYVDAKLSSDFTNQVTGPTPVGTAAVHDNTNKYWELTGALTSNITVEANTFLEGDQPHAVSVWFNSSNLEANVSNTCVFSVSDQEHLNSQNLNLQSNTWHNLTYAYQGEGGSRVAYLDGRKVLEDQAEDTFGDYPPFAMTGYSQGGYVVSANNFYTATNNERDPWRAYDGIDNNDATHNWGTTIDAAASFETTGDYLAKDNTGGNPDTFVDETGTSHRGHWNKIKLPYKLRVESISINCTLNYNRRAGKVAILGSNDNQKWYLLKDVTTNLDFTTVTPQIVPMENNKNKGFKYLILVVKTAPGSGGAVTIREISYQGHRENDLVRLPDPTNVLKYPHVALTGPAQRGYVASASNENLPNYPAWEAFDDKYTDIASTSSLHRLDRWQPNGGYASSGTPRNADGTETTTLAGSSPSDYDGEWLQLESPNKVNITSYRLYNSTDYVTDYNAHTVVLLGSNTGIDDWVDIGSGETVLSWSPNTSTANGSHTLTLATVNTSGNTGFYKYHRLVIRKVTNQNLPVIYQFQLYGTEEATSIPIQIGGGNIDKVANFRVYDKFVGEDQALEIWDAQKDTFRGVKNSVTLHKGRLGIGTTEPEGRLAVLDEPHNLEEFPPRAMSGYKTYFEGHGEFCASASEEYSKTIAGNASGDEAWKNFDKGSTNWTGGSSYTGTNTTYEGTHTTGGYGGDYIELKLPYKIKLQEFIIQPSPTLLDRWSKSGVIMAKNTNNDTWTNIFSWSGSSVASVDAYNPVYFKGVDTSNAFDTFRLVITSVYSQPYVTLFQWKLFGTREQGQSVLHDGQLTLTKNLTVPRIGPALDADDTPRRDRLVVEYNTSTNPTFEGAVRDTSGRGNDGVFYGASYDASAKAFDFDGTNDYIEHDANFIDGINAYTMSIWVNPDAVGNNWRGLIKMGDNSSGNSAGLYLAGQVGGTANDGKIAFTTYGNNLISSTIPTEGNWIHICGTYDGGTRRLYLDGVQIATDTATINLTGTSKEFIIGAASPTSEYFDGSISNFKLYDTALTAEEVKTLYDMGRNGSVANPQPLHIAAPLYSPGLPVQCISYTVHDMVVYASAAEYYLTPLEIQITPKFGNSKIQLQWTINYEATEHSGFRIYRDSILIGYNKNTSSSSTWNTIAVSPYDAQTANTPANITIAWVDTPNTTGTVTYKLLSHTTYVGSQPFYLNRSQSGTGSAYVENMVSYKSAVEIAQ